ncbi:MAG: signal peptidase II, partial [Cyclobacteriaceae bacterium]|nr:signal peptidase II [Cyclobacteriaceae bacterium]
HSLVKKGAPRGLLICMGLILGGAIGNVIDSTFYGVFLDNAPIDSPTPWFHGQVIDMLFFPIFDGVFPEWIPWVGGDHFLFFSPVFNIADSSIFMGVLFIMIFQSKYFPKPVSNEIIREENNEETETPVENVDEEKR